MLHKDVHNILQIPAVVPRAATYDYHLPYDTDPGCAAVPQRHLHLIASAIASASALASALASAFASASALALVPALAYALASALASASTSYMYLHQHLHLHLHQHLHLHTHLVMVMMLTGKDFCEHTSRNRPLNLSGPTFLAQPCVRREIATSAHFGTTAFPSWFSLSFS